jgi:DNA-binding response OmpR family regulator
MNVAPSAITGSVKIVAVGDLEVLARGRPAEFRHRGLSLTAQSTPMAALLEVGRDPASMVLVPTDLPDVSVTEFIDVLRSFAHVPVIAGIAQGCTRQAIIELFDHGIASTVTLPVTPGLLAEAVLTSRAPEPPEEIVIEIGNLALDDARHRVTWFRREVPLTPKSFDILRYMLLAHPRVIPLQELMHLVGDTRAERPVRARNTIGRLRSGFVHVMPYHDTPIETVRRIGYRLRP